MREIMAHKLPAMLLITFLCLVCAPSPAASRATKTKTTATPVVEPQPVQGAAKEYLDAHNKARAEVGVEPLKWSDYLANATSRVVRYQRIKMGCQFANLTSGKYGANQLWSGGYSVLTPQMAVETWVQEKKYYNYDKNSCQPNHHCGVYTQVVWRKSLELGCAQATCTNKESPATLTVCFYNPPGNYYGEKPY